MTREEKNNTEKKHGATWLQICKVFARNYERSPEGDLLFAVISLAVWDIFNSREAERDDAIRFFKEGRHNLFCDFIGLDWQWVSEIMRDYAGLEI